MENSIILNAADFQDDVLANTTKKIIANAEKFYLLSTSLNMKLCNVIDKLSKTLNDKAALTRVRFAYDVDFELETTITTGNNESGDSVRSLAELLDKLEYDENLMLKRNDYHIVINDDNVTAEIADRAVAQLFQQTVFLNINIDIKKKSEIKKALLKERFRANYQKLREQIETQKKYLEAALEHANLTENGKARVSGMIESLEKMIEETEKARKRPLRIAAMGTKKAGKSVVINSILKRDYAPTSSELPTPNVIKYIPAAKDSDLILDYKGEKKKFDSAQDLSDFIGNEFEEAQKHTGEGSGLADMIIYYPSDDLNGYEVWDTPGPNFAGAGEEHQKIAEECIKAADVCIFVMNYSNHLTTDEINFLNQIHQAFEENNKFYSLFITVNRIDERYSAEVEKSVNRILDYISGRLEDLNYKNIVIFGTSALQSFYLDKILSLLKESEIDEDDTLADAVKKFKRKNKEFMTQAKFIETAIGNLEDFHDIENPDAKILENFSGIPQLWRHVKYIGEQKVDTEIVDSVIGKCETQFSKINNALLVTELQKLTEEDKARLEDLERKIIELSNTVSRAMNNIEAISDNNNFLKAAQYDAMEEADSIKRQAVNNVKTRGINIVKSAVLTDYDVEQMQAGKTTSNFEKIMGTLNDFIDGIIKNSSEKLVKLVQVEGNSFGRKVEDAVQKAQETIIEETERVKESIDSDSVAGNMMHAFTLPEFPVSLDKLSSSFSISAEVSTSAIRDIAKNSIRVDQEGRIRIETRRRKSRGFWEGVRGFFGKKYYEDVEVPYTVNVEKADAKTFKENVQIFLQNIMRDAVEDAHEDMKNDVKNKIAEIFNDVRQQCEDINANYQEIFNQFKEDIDAAKDETGEHKKAIEHDISVLVDIKNNILPFFELWDDILQRQKRKVS